MQFTPLKPINHSATAFKTFLGICERRYAFEKCQPWTGSVDAARGDQIHAALERGARRAIEHSGPILLGDLAGEFCADREPDSRRSRDPVRWPLNTYTLEQWLTRAIDGCADLRFSEAEEWYRKEIPMCERPLVAKIDGICTHGPAGLSPCIIDWKSVKTMGKRFTPYEVKRSVQGLIYSWLTGIRNVAFGFFTPNHDIEWITATYSDQDLANWEVYMIRHAKIIEDKWQTQQWRTCQPGGLCSVKWCPLYKECYPKVEKK